MLMPMHTFYISSFGQIVTQPSVSDKSCFVDAAFLSAKPLHVGQVHRAAFPGTARTLLRCLGRGRKLADFDPRRDLGRATDPTHWKCCINRTRIVPR